MSKPSRLALLLAGIAISVLAFVPPLLEDAPFGTSYGTVRPGALSAAVHVLVGLSFIVLGVAACSAYAPSRVGQLMVLVGFLWFVSDLAFVPGALPFTIAHYGGTFYLAVIAHLYVSFPTGELESRLDRALVAAIYVWLPVGLAIEAAFWDPVQHTNGPVPRNLFMVRSDLHLNEAVASWNGVIGAGFVTVVVFTMVAHWRRATPPARRALAPVFTASIPLAAAVVGMIVDGAMAIPPSLHVAIWDLVPLALAALPVGFLVGLVRAQLARAAVGRLLIDLGRAVRPVPLQDVIARTLSDPTVELGFWIPERNAYVDQGGRCLDVDAPGPGRGVKLFLRGGEPAAALICDAALANDPELLESVVAAARLSLENERLQALVQAQLKEVKESRARILEEADAARRRIERDLHDGAQQRLVTAALALRTAQAGLRDSADVPTVAKMLDDTADQLRDALRELRELAQGIHPTILTEEGLGPALESLARRCTVPVQIRAVPDDRLPEAVEVTAYFVVAEALANVAKHSAAASSQVTVLRDRDRLVVTIVDDGVGGADAGRGSGLRGLRDRVATVGGRFDVRDGAGGGTVVEATLPCESS